MRVFPYDDEIATLFSQFGLDCFSQFPEKKAQLDVYNNDIMSPFLEQMLGFKLQDIKETIPYVAKFFALPFDTTQPEQGDILSKSVIVDGQPEEVCI
jgi:hypothetical protein